MILGTGIFQFTQKQRSYGPFSWSSSNFDKKHVISKRSLIFQTSFLLNPYSERATMFYEQIEIFQYFTAQGPSPQIIISYHVHKCISKMIKPLRFICNSGYSQFSCHNFGNLGLNLLSRDSIVIQRSKAFRWHQDLLDYILFALLMDLLSPIVEWNQTQRSTLSSTRTGILSLIRFHSEHDWDGPAGCWVGLASCWVGPAGY